MKKRRFRTSSVLLNALKIISAGAVGGGQGIIPPAKPNTEDTDKSSAVSTSEGAAEILNHGDSPRSAAENEPLTACGGNCGHAPTIIIPGIGQSDVFLLDENGNRAKGKNGRDINTFPAVFETDNLIKPLVWPLIRMLITRRDKGFTDLAAKAIGKAIAKNAIGFNGQPVNKVEVRRFPQSVGACSENNRRDIYNTIPLQDFSKVAGEDHLYYFAYNSYGNNFDNTKALYEFIQQVKRETGHGKINIVPISLGSTIAVSLMELYPQVSDDLDKIVFIVPALDGSRMAGDIYKGTLRLHDEALYKTLMPSLMGDNANAYRINALLHIFPKQVILDLLNKTVEQLKEVVMLNCTMLWGLVPGEDYDTLAGKYLTDPARAEIKRQTDVYRKAQMNVPANIQTFIDRGVKIFDIADYNFPIYSLVPSHDTHNGDGLIHLTSSAPGVTCGYLDTPLPSDYVQQNTRCSDPGKHNHISPDGIVDASTCVLAETTFFFYKQDHEGTGRNDVIMKLATELLLYDRLSDVHAMPEKFPQFNVGRETKWLRIDFLPKAKEVDQSSLSAEDAAELQGAIEQCETMLDNTVVVHSDYTDAEKRLLDILIKIGVKEAPKEKKLNKFKKAFWKRLSNALCKQ